MTSRKFKIQLILVAISMFAAPASIARERPWYKYENAYFEAYSDASERKVRRLLDELENFRAAVTQIVNFKIPAGSAKTQVIIYRSRKDFRNLTNDRNLGGFVLGMNGIPHIVLPAGSADDWSKAAIRHEFTHVLFAYSGYRFPDWYNEGFAEFMSATEFQKKDTQFTIGDTTGRYRANSQLIPWETLMAPGFEFHTIESRADRSNAYLQSWVLVHYLTIGGDNDLTQRLGHYLGRYSAGQTSRDVFVDEFGMSPKQFGELVMEKYKRRATYYVVNFLPAVQDFEFAKSETNADELQVTIDSIRQQVQAWTGD